VLLFIEHQELVRSAAAALRNGIEGLPTADLRTARLRADRVQKRIHALV